MIAQAINRRAALLSLAGATASSVALAVPAISAAHAGRANSATAFRTDNNLDAELLALGAEFDAAYAAEEAARAIARVTDDWTAWDDAYSRAFAAVERIETVPARTVNGIRLKARCIQWCYGDDFVDLGAPDSTDLRLAAQIIRELLALT